MEVIVFKINHSESNMLETVHLFYPRKNIPHPLFSISEECNNDIRDIVINELSDFNFFSFMTERNICGEDVFRANAKNIEEYNKFINGEEYELIEENLNATQTREYFDEKFKKQKYSYNEVYCRDEDAFNGSMRINETSVRPFNVDLYAVVAINENKYLGHVYSWISPVDPSMCFSLGIRNTLASLYDNTIPSNITSILFEGVRQFAISKNASTISVDKPLPIAIRLLNRIGFRNVIIDGFLCGQSLSNNTRFAADNQTYYEIDTPIIDGINVRYM
jgi:hypothetical protein